MSDDANNLHFLPVPADPPSVPCLPQLPPRLAKIINAMQPKIFPGSGPDDPGLLIPGAPPEYDPDAAFVAAQHRALLEPAPYEVIYPWLGKFGMALMVANRGTSDAAVRGFNAGVIMVSGKLGRCVWSDDVLLEALRTFDWWPAPKKLHEFLERQEQRVRRLIRDLQACADAPRDQPAPAVAQERQERYEPRQDGEAAAPLEPVTDQLGASLRHVYEPHGVPEKSAGLFRGAPHVPMRSVDDQIRALGFTPGQPIIARSQPAPGEAEYRSWLE